MDRVCAEVAVDELSLLQWDSIKLEITPVEAMILLSLKEEDRSDDQGTKVQGGKVITQEQERQLRHILYCASLEEEYDDPVEFSLGMLRRIDFKFEPFAGAEGEEMVKLRIKISNAIHQCQNAIIRGDFSPLEPYTEMPHDLYEEVRGVVAGR